ncbi:MAG: hypothetical protein KAJ33_05375 [Thermoplasmata archaeon]|nr:hypothetical protein [Thermoplasmata archaeon]
MTSQSITAIPVEINLIGAANTIDGFAPSAKSGFETSRFKSNKDLYGSLFSEF